MVVNARRYVPVGGMLPDRLTGAVGGKSATFLLNVCDSVSYSGAMYTTACCVLLLSVCVCRCAMLCVLWQDWSAVLITHADCALPLPYHAHMAHPCMQAQSGCCCTRIIGRQQQQPVAVGGRGPAATPIFSSRRPAAEGLL
jgi:hypothetical protein